MLVSLEKFIGFKNFIRLTRVMLFEQRDDFFNVVLIALLLIWQILDNVLYLVAERVCQTRCLVLFALGCELGHNGERFPPLLPSFPLLLLPSSVLVLETLALAEA